MPSSSWDAADRDTIGRARLIFRKVSCRSEVRLAFVAAAPDWVIRNRWWAEGRSLLVILQEHIKLGYYLFKGYLI